MKTMNRGGDVLASGGVRATWASGSDVTRKKWDKIFKEEAPIRKAHYVFQCPVHGTFVSQVECFLSGGYPMLDEYKGGACQTEGCEERCSYAGYQAI